MRIHHLSSVAIVCLATALSIPAWAAEAADAAEDSAAKSDIVVTGTRTGEGLQQSAGGGALGDKKLLDTPFSVTVVDSEDIAKRQATTIAQIFVNDPSVFSFATAGTTNWWGTQIRGMGVRNYYVDDVPLLLYWGGDYPLEPVESVQALKGLSGFMYGFGAPGGVISYKTKRPTAKPMVSTEFGYRNNSVFFGHLDAGGPIGGTGKLGYRLNLAAEKGTAYNDAGVNRLLGSLALEYAFSPALKWYSTVTYESSNLKHEPFHIYWDGFQGTTLPDPTYEYSNLNVRNSFYKSNTLSLATGLEWQISPGWKANLTYGYTRKLHRSNKMFIYMLNSSGDYAGYAYNFAELDQNHFAQLMVRGNFDTGAIRHELVFGGSYQPSFTGNGNGWHWDNDFNGNIHQPQPFLVTRNIDFSTDGIPFDEQQIAGFASDTLYLGQKWQAIIGARYTRYMLLDTDGDPDVDSGYRTSALTPTFALIFKPADNISLYGSYVESMEPGSRVSAEFANYGGVLGATVSRQYEAGVKYEGQGLSFTAAGFRVERANQITQLKNGLRYLTQDGLSVYKGLEAIGNYRATPHLSLGLGAVYLDPSIRNVSEGNEALLGHIPAEAARWQVVGNAEYQIPSVRGLTVHGNVRYFGKAPTDDYNHLFIPGRTLANIGFSYDALAGGRRVALTGNINNLLNKKYWGLENIGEGINGSLGFKIYW